MKMLQFFLFFSLNIFCGECELANAVKNGDIETVVKYANTSNVNGCDPNTTLLHEAIKIKDLEKAIKITKHLLKLGADIKRVNKKGLTALELAFLRSFVLRDIIYNKTQRDRQNEQIHSDEDVVSLVVFVQSKL